VLVTALTLKQRIPSLQNVAAAYSEFNEAQMEDEGELEAHDEL